MIDIATSLLSIVLLLYAVAIHPSRARCPDRWFVAHASRSGLVSCNRTPHDDLDDNHGGIEPEGTLTSRLYCTGGATMRTDGRSAWCQR